MVYQRTGGGLCPTRVCGERRWACICHPTRPHRCVRHEQPRCPAVVPKVSIRRGLYATVDRSERTDLHPKRRALIHIGKLSIGKAEDIDAYSILLRAVSKLST